MKKIKKLWHQLSFAGAIIIALFARAIWASALVFAVGIFVVGAVELKRMQKVKSAEFLKVKTITPKNAKYP